MFSMGATQDESSDDCDEAAEPPTRKKQKTTEEGDHGDLDDLEEGKDPQEPKDSKDPNSELEKTAASVELKGPSQECFDLLKQLQSQEAGPLPEWKASAVSSLEATRSGGATTRSPPSLDLEDIKACVLAADRFHPVSDSFKKIGVCSETKCSKSYFF